MYASASPMHVHSLRSRALRARSTLTCRLRSGAAARSADQQQHDTLPGSLARREGFVHSSLRPPRPARRERKSWHCEVHRGVECWGLNFGGARGRSGAQPTNYSGANARARPATPVVRTFATPSRVSIHFRTSRTVRAASGGGRPRAGRRRAWPPVRGRGTCPTFGSWGTSPLPRTVRRAPAAH